MTPTSGGGPQCPEIRLFLLELFSVLNKSDLMLKLNWIQVSITQIKIWKYIQHFWGEKAEKLMSYFSNTKFSVIFNVILVLYVTRQFAWIM